MKFKIKNIPVRLFLGVPEEERSEKQEILVTVKFQFETKKAEISDNIKDTVDYFQIYQSIQQFPGGKPFQLVEHLHAELGKMLQTKFPNVKKWKIKIQKFPFEAGSVSIEK